MFSYHGIECVLECYFFKKRLLKPVSGTEFKKWIERPKIINGWRLMDLRSGHSAPRGIKGIFRFLSGFWAAPSGELWLPLTNKDISMMDALHLIPARDRAIFQRRHRCPWLRLWMLISEKRSRRGCYRKYVSNN